MAAHGWGKDSSVEDWLFAEPYRFDFFQAVKLIEMAHGFAASVGEGVEPDKEAVRFKSRVDTEFPASDIAEIIRPDRPGEPVEMIVNIMGLAGCLGPLPVPYTELIIERVAHKDTALEEFLDIFNHRLVSLMYRIRKKHLISLNFMPPGKDHLSAYLYSLIGLGTRGLRERMQVQDRALLFYTAILAQQPRSMVGLECILSDYFQVKVKGEQLVGCWQNLDEEQRTAIGMSGHNQRLGRDAVILGSRIWDQQGSFEITLGPLTIEEFLDFLPTGWRFAPLCELTRFYVGDELDFSFRLVLKASEVPQSKLGVIGGARLGWTSWLSSGKWQGDNREIKISPRSLAFNPLKARIPIFAEIPLDELFDVISKATIHNFTKSSIVLRQGYSGDSLYIISSGVVNVIRREADERERIVATLKEGDFFGEVAFLTGTARTATVVTAEDSVILEFSRQDLEEIMKKYPRVKGFLQMAYLRRTREY